MFDPEALAKIIHAGGVQFRQNSVAWIFYCPRCHKKDKLYIRKRDGRFVCWVCKEKDNFKGRPEYALHELYGVPIKELQAQLYGGDIPEQLPNMLELDFEDLWGDWEGEEEEAKNPEAVCWPPDFVELDNPVSIAGLKYVQGRGISQEHIKTYQIKYHPKTSRVIFPIIINNSLIGWQGRYIYKTSQLNEKTGNIYEIPKILTSKNMSEWGGKLLMFQDRLVNSPHCVLAEGPVSAIKAHLCGGNVASMGKAVTKTQLATIAQFTNKLYLALDPDAAEDIARIANDDFNFECYLLEPPTGFEDLGAADELSVYGQFKNAPRLNRGALILSLGSNLIF